MMTRTQHVGLKYFPSRAYILSGMILALLLAACGGPSAPSDPLFVRLSADETGIDFVNALPESAEFNIIDYLYYYNGGGVGAGDVNGDGLTDLFFTSNLDQNRLYLNQGNFVFEDVTESAGVGGTADWSTGVTMADVNGDGALDIYVSVVSALLNRRGANELYINNRDGTFSERAAEFGLAHVGFATEASFFDYDNDGDLDAYLLNHSTHSARSIGTTELRLERHPHAGDMLLRNDNNRFVDVTAEAGILGSALGYGLSVSIFDFNVDGCMDIYVANDFHENDYLYKNNCDGTFRESIVSATGHTSRFSMGTDAADFNNDGRPDIAVLDMLPADEEILKISGGAESLELYELKAQAGYHHQFARNTLQLNRGLGRFSDVGYLAGVYATDWSWAALFGDLDNDGLQDLYVTNGIYRRPNDLDYINYSSNEAIAAAQGLSEQETDAALIAKMPQVRLANYAFRNSGDLTFEDRAFQWGLAEKGFSNGAAVADLDNDGDLDLVVNNVNDSAWIYRNTASDREGGNFLMIDPLGEEPNTSGIGLRVFAITESAKQYRELATTRGWQSSSELRLHFGLGNASEVDSLVMVWPDGSYEVRVGVAANQILEVRQADAKGVFRYPSPDPIDPQFRSAQSPPGVEFVHDENGFVDFNREILMPHKVSIDGPALATADVNGDGVDDIFVGGAKRQHAQLLVSTRGAYTLSSRDAMRSDSLQEDVDAEFFDADGDGDLDLYVVSGGNEFWGQNEALQDRLYLNDGTGNFERWHEALPEFFHNGCCVAPSDFDGDGDIDLFVGSRVVSREYGIAPTSYLLENDGTGRYSDVTLDLAPDIATHGMITDAAWSDVDGDGAPDLILTAEWQPVSAFLQRDGRFVDETDRIGLAGTNGWWNTVEVADLNGDGFEDLLLGNLGLNSQLKANAEEPVRLYIKDFDGNGSLDQFLTRYVGGVSYPFASTTDIVRQIEPLRKKYTTYTEFGARRLEDIFSRSEVGDADVLEAYTFASAIAHNIDGRFRITELPVEAQFAPIYAFQVGDFNGDGVLDAVAAGNFSGVRPDRGRYDASYGLFLAGDANGELKAIGPAESGLLVEGEVREIRRLETGDASLLVFGRNGLSLAFVEPRSSSTRPAEQ